MTPSERELETAVRAALDPAAAPTLPEDFAARVAARAVTVAHPPHARVRAGRPVWRWWLAPVAAAVLLVGVGVQQYQTRRAAERQARAEQLQELQYAVEFARAQWATVTGTAMSSAFRNLSVSLTRKPL
ncbi:MAG: hypothetical protein ACRD2E_06860 [Terriglobales bacterium]